MVNTHYLRDIYMLSATAAPLLTKKRQSRTIKDSLRTFKEGWEQTVRRFEDAIERAKESCKSASQPIEKHFADAGKTSPMPNGGTKEIPDFYLTRYACYLVAQNGDPRKTEIAQAQTYFAIQTRYAEIQQMEEY